MGGVCKRIDHQEFLENITHIYFSHEHPDHFSIPFLSQFQKKKTRYYNSLSETFDKGKKF